MAYIEIRNLEKTYRKHKVINNISFNISKGDVLGLIGDNGAGKSTLMSMLVTLVKPSKGDIIYKGESIVSCPKIIRGNIGYVPQDIALYEDLSGMDNIRFFAKSYHIPKKDMQDKIDMAIDIMGLEIDVLNKKVKHLSGGMKRRINIGVALLNNPDLIVMDEPTVGIDIVSKDYILGVINKLSTEGKTIIYASHYLDEIEELCNKVCILNKGNIIDFSSLDDIRKKEVTFRQHYLDINRDV